MIGFILNKNSARVGGYIALALSSALAFAFIKLHGDPISSGVVLGLLLFSLFVSGIFWGMLFAFEKKITWV